MLTVLNVGYPFAPVSPDAVGGAEQVLSRLDHALVSAGHRSIVIAPDGSRCAGELLKLRAVPGDLSDDVIRSGQLACRRAVDAVIARVRPDVLHFHGVDCAEYLPRGGDTPLVITLHLWPDRYPAAIRDARRSDLHLVCVSRAQRAAMPPASRADAYTILNGVDLALFRPTGVRRRHVLLLGRISPEKGFHLAIDAARRIGLPVVLAGSLFAYRSHVEYFEHVIRPRLGGDVAYVGPVGGATKRELLASAVCTSIPSVVPETSSLVAMESLASGTPVVALRTPALTELIEHGRNGYLVDTVDAMSEAFRHVEQLSSDACRRTAQARCCVRRMAGQYLGLYQTLALRTDARSTLPQAGWHDGGTQLGA